MPLLGFRLPVVDPRLPQLQRVQEPLSFHPTLHAVSAELEEQLPGQPHPPALPHPEGAVRRDEDEPHHLRARVQQQGAGVWLQGVAAGGLHRVQQDPGHEDHQSQSHTFSGGQLG